jgi:hypothetical protein
MVLFVRNDLTLPYGHGVEKKEVIMEKGKSGASKSEYLPGVCNIGPEVGKTDTVMQAEFRKKDRRKSLYILSYP